MTVGRLIGLSAIATAIRTLVVGAPLASGVIEVLKPSSQYPGWTWVSINSMVHAANLPPPEQRDWKDGDRVNYRPGRQYLGADSMQTLIATDIHKEQTHG